MGFTITVQELKQRMDQGDKIVLVDVREPWEYQTAKIPGSILIPLATLPQSLDKLDKNAEIVCQCHLGMRSADATAFLSQQGFKSVKNLVGGIEAWSTQIDPSVPRY
ncbi:MAG: rhodanese-like domain-containing protein [Nitrospira sp.]